MVCAAAGSSLASLLGRLETLGAGWAEQIEPPVVVRKLDAALAQEAALPRGSAAEAAVTVEEVCEHARRVKLEAPPSPAGPQDVTGAKAHRRARRWLRRGRGTRLSCSRPPRRLPPNS